MQAQKHIHWSSIWPPSKRENRKIRQMYNALDIQTKQNSMNNEVILVDDEG